MGGWWDRKGVERMHCSGASGRTAHTAHTSSPSKPQHARTGVEEAEVGGLAAEDDGHAVLLRQDGLRREIALVHPVVDVWGVGCGLSDGASPSPDSTAQRRVVSASVLGWSDGRRWVVVCVFASGVFCMAGFQRLARSKAGLTQSYVWLLISLPLDRAPCGLDVLVRVRARQRSLGQSPSAACVTPCTHAEIGWMIGRANRSIEEIMIDRSSMPHTTQHTRPRSTLRTAAVEKRGLGVSVEHPTLLQPT